MASATHNNSDFDLDIRVSNTETTNGQATPDTFNSWSCSCTCGCTHSCTCTCSCTCFTCCCTCGC